MPERLIASMFIMENGIWKKVAEQDVSDFGYFEMANFYAIQHDQDRIVVPKRKEVAYGNPCR